MVHLAIWSRWNWPGILGVKVQFPSFLEEEQTRDGKLCVIQVQVSGCWDGGICYGYFLWLFHIGLREDVLAWELSQLVSHTTTTGVTSAVNADRRGWCANIMQSCWRQAGGTCCRCWEVKCNNIADCWATQANIEARSGLTLIRTHETSHLLEILYLFWVAGGSSDTSWKVLKGI